MGLEALGTKYVDDTAKFAGKVIKEVINKINKKRRTKVREVIMNTFPDDGFCVTTKSGKRRGTGKLTDLLNDLKLSSTFC